MNTSATGGYLSQAAGPLEGKALAQFLQAWIAGLSGLAGNLVRPAWQPEPPDIPDAGTAWASFTINSRSSDQYPYVAHVPGADQMQRHETLNIVVSFYDLGINGEADNYAQAFRDASAIAQNREPLTNNGMGLVKIGELLTVPTLFKARWLYRVTVEVVIRREIDLTFPVLDLESANGDLYTDTALPPQPITS